MAKDAVWKFMNNSWGNNDLSPGNGKLCWFQFADLQHSGELSLVAVYDGGGTADCNYFDVYDKTPAGLEDFDFFNPGDPFFESIEDLNGDGNHQLIVGRSFASAGRDHCAAIWPVVYAWDGTGYADVSGQFKHFYRKRLQELTRQLAPSPTPTPASEAAQTSESPPSSNGGLKITGASGRIIRPQPTTPSESESPQETADTGDRDCLKAEAAKIQRFLGISRDAGMLDAIKWKNSDNPDDREFAIDVLQDIATPEVIGDLRTLSDDPDPDVAGPAKGALANITTPSVYPTIQGKLMTKDTGVPSAK